MSKGITVETPDKKVGMSTDEDLSMAEMTRLVLHIWRQTEPDDPTEPEDDHKLVGGFGMHFERSGS